MLLVFKDNNTLVYDIDAFSGELKVIKDGMVKRKDKDSAKLA